MIVPPTPVSLFVGVFQVIVVDVLAMLIGLPSGVWLVLGGAPDMVISMGRVIIPRMDGASCCQNRAQKRAEEKNIPESSVHLSHGLDIAIALPEWRAAADRCISHAAAPKPGRTANRLVLLQDGRQSPHTACIGRRFRLCGIFVESVAHRLQGRGIFAAGTRSFDFGDRGL